MKELRELPAADAPVCAGPLAYATAIILSITIITFVLFGEPGTLLAQGAPSTFPGCQPGVRGVSDDATRGMLLFEIQICGQRGRLSTSMGAAPRTSEIQATLDDFPPNIVNAGFPWAQFWTPQLCEIPSGSDLPGANVTVRFISFVSTADVSTTITLSPDKDKPKLITTSEPRKGTKVKPGDVIKVTMRASERYEDAGSGWQTGVKKLLLRDESGNRDVSPHFENSGPPRPCDRKQWEQWLTVNYTVPPDPPPVVRLRAIAEDFAGNIDTDTAEFPIQADWSGTLTWSMKVETPGGSWTKFHGSAELVVNRDNQGKLTGTIVGDVKMDGLDRETGLCTSITTATTTRGKAKLDGFHASGASVMTLATKDIELLAQGQTTPCAGTPLPIPSADFAVALHTKELRQRADKSFHASGTTRTNQGGSIATNEFSLTLRPAAN